MFISGAYHHIRYVSKPFGRAAPTEGRDVPHKCITLISACEFSSGSRAVTRAHTLDCGDSEVTARTPSLRVDLSTYPFGPRTTHPETSESKVQDAARASSLCRMRR